MTQLESRSEDLLARMGDLGVPPDLDADPARQHRMVASINARLDRLADDKIRLRRQRRTFLLALAASISLAFGALGAKRWLMVPGSEALAREPSLRALEGRVEVAGLGRTTSAADGLVPLTRTDVVRTAPASRALATLPSGAQATIEELSTLTLRAPRGSSEELELGRGGVEVSVPHLPAHASFQVRTSNALVTVHGTRFSVRVDSADGRPRTLVRVSEGTVWVDSGGHQVVLERGSHWSSEAATLADAPAREPAQAPESASLRSRPGSAHEATPAELSTLAEENRVYLTAMREARIGDDRAALNHLEIMLARFPKSPLAQNAEVERFRALERLGRHAEAARDARRYIESHPRGFALAEARSLLSH